jgi:hypothetical protein
VLGPVSTSCPEGAQGRPREGAKRPLLHVPTAARSIKPLPRAAPFPGKTAYTLSSSKNAASSS